MEKWFEDALYSVYNMINNTKPPQIARIFFFIIFFFYLFQLYVHIGHYDTIKKGSMYDLNCTAVQIASLLK